MDGGWDQISRYFFSLLFWNVNLIVLRIFCLLVTFLFTARASSDISISTYDVNSKRHYSHLRAWLSAQFMSLYLTVLIRTSTTTPTVLRVLSKGGTGRSASALSWRAPPAEARRRQSAETAMQLQHGEAKGALLSRGSLSESGPALWSLAPCVVLGFVGTVSLSDSVNLRSRLAAVMESLSSPSWCSPTSSQCIIEVPLGSYADWRVLSWRWRSHSRISRGALIAFLLPLPGFLCFCYSSSKGEGCCQVWTSLDVSAQTAGSAQDNQRMARLSRIPPESIGVVCQPYSSSPEIEGGRRPLENGSAHPRRGFLAGYSEDYI